MYLSHFNLQEKPFKVSTDPKFLWLGEKHREALETLRYGILHGDGYVVLTGDVGTGKTMLAMALAQDLGDDVIVARLPYPDVEVLDFLKLISTAYGINDDVRSKASFRDRFESFLRSCFSAGKRVVLILDEAQRMAHEHLEELLQLSSIQQNGAGLLNIVFVGQNEFNDILQQESNKGLKQRIAVNYNLIPLTKAETEQYISHRLSVVRCKEEIFTPEAVQEIFLYSNGIPRLINVVSDLALLMTYLEGGRVVQPHAVARGVERLRLPGERPELMATEEIHPPVAESGTGQELPPVRETEAGPGVILQKTPKKAHGRLLWAGGAVLLALLIGVLLLSGRQNPAPRDGKVEASDEKRGHKTGPGQAGGESATAEPAGGASVSPLSEIPLSKQTDESSSLAQKKVSGGSEQPGVPKRVEPQPSRARTQRSVGSKVSGPPPGKGSPEPPRDTRFVPEKETEPDGNRPGPATGTSLREPSQNEIEEAEPGRAIDWLLEKRERK